MQLFSFYILYILLTELSTLFVNTATVFTTNRGIMMLLQMCVFAPDAHIYSLLDIM